MASDTSGPAPTRDRTRVALVVCFVLAVGLAALLVPALTGGVVDSPAESLVPGDAIRSGASGDLGALGSVQPGGAGAGAGGGFGALNPGRSTAVGGPTGVDGTAFDSRSTTVHFTVRSSAPGYWRTGAYDAYTGSGWRQNGGTDPLQSQIGGDGIDGPRVEYEVELNRSATALPTVWRPRSVDGVSDLEVTDQRAIRSDSPVEAGTTFSGVSRRPPQDPAVLRASGTDYPDEIERRYTSLPNDTPSRLGRFTDNLTADADSPYETAVAIERWLESNKDYSLAASTRSDHIADTFVFEMDRGYCEYFATAMTAMLRTQDIPARYVVGYSTGQRTGEKTYQVRGMNAHAWVEVYFEDVGWVKFDPTPGSARLQAEQESMAENESGDYSPTEQGSPGETFTPDGTNGTTDVDGPDGPQTTPGGETEDGYRLSLNRTAVPGTPVAVTVTRDGTPQPGVRVLFNGDPIGRTDANGTVVGTVPYADELRVTVDDTAQALSPPGDLPDRDGRFYTVASPDGGDGHTPAGVGGASPVAANLTVPVETNATVAVTGDAVPGGEVTVTATVDGAPVRNGTVLVDGTEVATTGDDGRATVTLPDASGNVSIVVERDPVRGQTTVTIPELSVTVEPTAPFPLPYTEAVVTVTSGGDRVASAPVRVDGEQVATTDINGTATITLPASAIATVSATGAGVTAETTVSNLFVNLAAVVVAVLASVGAVLAVALRRGYRPRDVLAFLRALPGTLVRYSQWALVTLATRWDDLLAAAIRRLRRTGGYLRAFLEGRVTLDDLRAALLAWLGETRRAVWGAPDDAPTTDAGDRMTVRRAWRRFRRRVSLRNQQTKTPGEIARHAVSRDGLPARPVRTLRDAFRDVEYGGQQADDCRDRAERAVREIEESGEEDES